MTVLLTVCTGVRNAEKIYIYPSNKVLSHFDNVLE